MKHRG